MSERGRWEGRCPDCAARLPHKRVEETDCNRLRALKNAKRKWEAKIVAKEKK